jgi:predicted transcriptional regulator
MSEKSNHSELLALTSSIVAAHVSHNSLPASELPQLLKDVHATLAAMSESKEEAQPKLEPAVPIRKSVMPDYIVCLEDGKKLKMLKRHLKTAYNMTPEEYRERWGLPPDYPMVAPNYAKQRSQLAKQIGLGSRQRKR